MTRYAKLIGIDLKHGYFGSGWCEDVEAAPAQGTDARMTNHRCLFQRRPGGADAYVEVDEGGKPLIPFNPGTELSFSLRLRDPGFALYTDPAHLADGPDYQLAYAAQPGDVYLTLAVKRDFNHPGGANLALSFSPRKLVWVYYVVTDRAGADSDFAIAASDPQLAWKLDNAADPVAAQLAGQYPGARVLRFVSSQPLACRQGGLGGMRLLVAGAQVMQNLASPSWRSFYRVRLAATETDVDAVMQIVKYLSNTSLTKV